MLDKLPLTYYTYTRDVLLARRDETVALLDATGIMKLKIIADKLRTDEEFYTEVLRAFAIVPETTVQ